LGGGECGENGGEDCELHGTGRFGMADKNVCSTTQRSHVLRRWQTAAGAALPASSIFPVMRNNRSSVDGPLPIILLRLSNFAAFVQGIMIDATVYYCWACDAHCKAVTQTDGRPACPHCSRKLTADSRLPAIAAAPPANAFHPGTVWPSPVRPRLAASA
jgi:DNA-directed RNA polymerase subunit RPC12/RpoP